MSEESVPQPSRSARPAKSDKAAQKRVRWARFGVLAVVLGGITGLGYAHQVGGVVRPVGVDALCPLGGLETFWKLITEGGTLQRVALSSVVLLIATTALALVFRRVFCGHLCPLGALQEFFGKLRAVLLRGKRLTMPTAIDTPARWLKYGVLAFFTVWTWQAAELVIRPYDPWVAWMHVTSKELLVEFTVGFAVLAISLAGSVLYDRFFCKYLCPTGAFLAIASKVAPFAVTRHEDTCIDCKLCDKACPANIEVSTVDRVTSAECLSCNECVNVCPVANTLENETRPSASGAGIRLSAGAHLGVTVAVFAAIVAGTTLSGTFVWAIKPLEKPATGQTINTEEIRGYMTVRDISAASGVPVEKFEEHFGIGADELDVPVKDLAESHGFDVHTDLRQFVADEQAPAK